MGSTLVQMASLFTCCLAVYTSKNFARTCLTSCEPKPETSRGIYYTRNIIPKTHMPVQKAMGSNLALPESSYTCCMALCISGNGSGEELIDVYANMGGHMMPCTLGL